MAKSLEFQNDVLDRQLVICADELTFETPPAESLHNSRLSIEQLIVHTQFLSGRVAEGERISISDIRRLLDVLPRTASGAQRVTIRNVFATVLGRFIAGVGVSASLAIMQAFVNWTGSSATSEAWRSDIFRVVAIIESELETASARSRYEDDKRVTRARGFIAANYPNPRLTLKEVAAYANLSPWHLARILKRVTGRSFLGHLRQSRITQAKHLLRATALSIKEVAITVGYGDSTQFGRHFKKECCQSPLAFRRAQQELPTISKN